MCLQCGYFEYRSWSRIKNVYSCSWWSASQTGRPWGVREKLQDKCKSIHQSVFVAIVQSPSCVWLLTLRPHGLTAACQASLSLCLFIQFMGFSWQAYWGGLPFPPVDHIFSELSTMTYPSWVGVHWFNKHELGQTLGDSEGQSCLSAKAHGVLKNWTGLDGWTATADKLLFESALWNSGLPW